MPRSSAYLLYGIPAFGASGVLAYIVWRSTTAVDELGAWVIAVNSSAAWDGDPRVSMLKNTSTARIAPTSSHGQRVSQPLESPVCVSPNRLLYTVKLLKQILLLFWTQHLVRQREQKIVFVQSVLK